MKTKRNIDKALERITSKQNLLSFLFSVLILIMAK